VAFACAWRSQPDQLALGLRVQEKEWTRLKAYLQCAISDRHRTEQDIEELEPRLVQLQQRLQALPSPAPGHHHHHSHPDHTGESDTEATTHAALTVKAHMLEGVLQSKRQVLDVKLRLEDKIRSRLSKEEQVGA
jgi:hypothetical protein